jgi:hypothetical protein
VDESANSASSGNILKRSSFYIIEDYLSSAYKKRVDFTYRAEAWAIINTKQIRFLKVMLLCSLRK